jgi:hypothetical protein
MVVHTAFAYFIHCKNVLSREADMSEPS